MKPFKDTISGKPVFLYLLPVFFVLHGYTVNFDLVPAGAALLLAGKYCVAAFILSLVAWLFYRDWLKAGILSFLILCFQFFFGNLHDLSKSWFPDSFLVKYSFILPASLLVFTGIGIYLKKTKSSLNRFAFYLNILLLILLAVEIGSLAITVSRQKPGTRSPGNEYVKCDSCKHPDIYLIIADGYPGNKELKDIFGYDNSPFEQELAKRGFRVVDSSASNYNFTPFSVASLLDMNWVQGIEGSNSSKKDMAICYAQIRNNRTLGFLAGIGYRFYNYSIFDFNKQNSLARPTFLLGKTKQILSQTFLHRLRRDLSYHLVTTLKLGSVIRNWRNADLRNNNKLVALTERRAAEKSDHPKFVYTHLVMPHYPYYFDSSGNQAPYQLLTDEHAFDKEAFLGYLKYGNTKYLELIDRILRTSARPPAIILMGDHGFREFREPIDNKYHFMNLNAVYLPEGNYSGFYKGQSNINQFRIILNTVFGQQLPLLKDSTSFLRE